MKPIHFSYIAAILSLIALAATRLPAGASEKPSVPRNVVFILADDLGWGELGCYGQEKIRTPHLDQLAREGTRFTQHYSGAPVCAPARCVLMTGKHLGHAEIRGNLQAKVGFPQFKEGQHPISAAAYTVAQNFKAAGFATGAMGKWGLGPVGSSGDPNQHGFNLFFGYNCQAVAHSFYPKSLWRNAEVVTINEIPVPGHGKVPDGPVRMEDWTGTTHASVPILAEGLKFIDDHKAGRFFLYLPFTEPHVSLQPPIKSVEEYPAEWDTEPYRGQNGYTPHPRPRAAYAAMISDLDRHVGAVVAKLREAGILDQTLIVFTSDNGTTHDGKDPRFQIGGVDAKFFNSARELRGFKGSVYEGGLRVPLIVRYPAAVKAGATSNLPGYFADWFPTLSAACGLQVPTGLDGENLWPAITGSEAKMTRRPMVWVYPEYSGQVAVRIDTFKVLRRGLATKRSGPWEVYDIANDIGEQSNLAESRKDLIEKAVAILREQTSENAIFPLTLPPVAP